MKMIYVDDSGDLGVKERSSENFVLGAIVFVSPEEAERAAAVISKYRRDIGWTDCREFKFFSKYKKVIKILLRELQKFNFKVYGNFIDKKEFLRIMKIVDKEKLYNYILKTLLDMVRPLDGATVIVDCRSDEAAMRRAGRYLQRELDGDGTKNLKISFEDSVGEDLLQLADIVVGAINRSMQPERADAQDYREIFKEKIVKIEELTEFNC